MTSRPSAIAYPPHIVGLTGGIATGKSTVSAFFAEMGASVIDADRIAGDMVRPGTGVWKQIRDHFGSGVLLSDGEINRPALGEIIFNDRKAKSRLNAIVHPAVFQEMDTKIREIETRCKTSLIIIDVPLLIETRFNDRLKHILLVHIPPSLQLTRLMKRDGLSLEAARARVESQMPIDDKKAFATHVIDNSKTRRHTRSQVAHWMKAAGFRPGHPC